MSEEKVVTEESQNELADFEWDTAGSNLELFGEPADETKLTDEEKQEAKDAATKEEESGEEGTPETTKKEGDEGDGEEKPVEVDAEDGKEDVEFFTETPAEEAAAEPGVADKVLSVIASELKDQGIFASVEIPEGDLTEEQFIELQEQEIENRIQDTFEGFFEEMDDDGKAFLKFKKEGGKTSEFFDVIKNTSAYPTGDIDNETYQKRLVKFYAERIEGLDEDEAQEKIDWLEQNGKLEKYAERYDKKIRTIEKEEKESIENKAKQLKKDREKSEEVFSETIKSTLEENDEIKKFPISKKEKTELLGYITKPSVKVGKGKFLTGLQADLNKLSQNPEGLVLLAKLLKSDFDTSNLSTKIETRQTKELKQKIQRAKEKTPTVSGSTKGRSLSDFFSDAPD